MSYELKEISAVLWRPEEHKRFQAWAEIRVTILTRSTGWIDMDVDHVPAGWIPAGGPVVAGGGGSVWDHPMDLLPVPREPRVNLADDIPQEVRARALAAAMEVPNLPRAQKERICRATFEYLPDRNRWLPPESVERRGR